MLKFKEFFLNLKLKRKIQLLGVCLILSLTATFMWFAAKYATEAVTNRCITITQDKMTNIKMFFDNMDSIIKGRFRHLETSISMREMLLLSNGLKKYPDDTSWRVDALIKDIANSQYISEVDVFNIKGFCLVSTDAEQDIDNMQISPKVINEVMHYKYNYWCDDGYSYTNTTEELSVYHVIFYKDSQIGIVRARLNTALLSDVYNYVGFNISSEIYLLSTSGHLILPKNYSRDILKICHSSYHDYTSQVKRLEPIYIYGKEKYFVQNMSLADYGIYLVSVTPFENLIGETRLIQLMIYGMGGICLILVLAFSTSMERIITKPILSLARKMEMVKEGNYYIRINNDHKDEIGVLSQNMDSMLDYLVNLMEMIDKVQKRKRELELISLQTQITPHFLYNSLDGISALVQMGENEKAYDMSKALGMFYRGVLSDGRNIISLRDELKIVQNYLEVQSIRYKDSFTYEINVDSELMDIGIVKLTIQPLVENAIYHGIRNVRRPGVINITSRVEENMAIISVMDNGAGMKVDETIMDGNKKGNIILHRKGFGMGNVNQRIQLYFGDCYGLKVHSVKDAGTCIEIRLPLLPYKENDDDFSFSRG